MTSPLKSLIACGTKLWLDSIDPELVLASRELGATGATSNPVIVSDLLRTGRFDDQLDKLLQQGFSDSEIAWQMTDQLVQDAQEVFLPVWQQTRGNDGYVSFELDPLLEDPESGPPITERVQEYIRLGRKWSVGNENRMIKVPATPAGLECLEQLVADGVTLNVTLIFTSRQYRAARDAVWRGAQRRDNLEQFKSVYSIFVSRVDVYSERHVTQLSPGTQGLVGIVNAKQIWAENQLFWSDHPTPLDQEMIFASTGTKKPEDAPTKYVAAFAGSDIETNPPATNDAVESSGVTFARSVDQLPPQDILEEIEREIDCEHLEQVLMDEGIKKFAEPQKALLALIAQKRAELTSTDKS
ncbi:MAG: transaldolase [Planctomycetaceae bacterium]|nr:transaldolase [Planctomycetaceae bacterium]MBP61390.1 transaldolase [Planctomycetaceae bacterium]